MSPLLPFLSLNEPIKIQGEIAWKSGGLELRFQVDDPCGSVRDGPGPARKRFDAAGLVREDGLWRATCFEAFFGRPGEEGYWELNLAAKGAWSLYRFNAYRSPQPPSPSEDFAISWLEAGEGGLACRLEAKVEPCPLEAALSAVARTETGIHYLSTKHAGQKPDYHLRESFTLRAEP